MAGAWGRRVNRRASRPLAEPATRSTASSVASTATWPSMRSIGWVVAAVFLVVGGLLRGLNLETNPPGLWQDEASTGLDAWMLWHTGRDRTGTFLPLISRSFGDYPLALYRYLAAPVVGLGGLTIANERMVAAVFGTVFIVATAAVVRRTLDDARAVAVIVSAALCPTWIHFSRYGSEAILLPATLTIGWLALEEGTRSSHRRWAIWAGAFSIALSAYTYHAVKLILPLWMMGLLVYQAPNIRRLWRQHERVHVAGPALLFAAIVLPSVWLAFSNDGQARGRTVLAWYHHQGFEALRVIANNYLSYFDPGMLFVRGGPAVAQSIPGLGMWNFVELPLMVTGFAVAFRAPATRRVYGFVLFWFLLGPLPGGVTYETHNMGRAIAWLPAPQIFSATGLVALFRWAWTAARSGRALPRYVGRTTAGLVCVAWLATAATVAHLTLVRYPRITERDWQFAVTRALKCAERFREDEKLIVSPAFPMAILFSQFHLAERLLGVKKPSTIWDLGDRRQVGAKELYLVPAGRRQPKTGQRVCTVVQHNTQQPAAFVYRGPR